MHGQGCPKKLSWRMIFAAKFFFLSALIAFGVGSGVLCAQTWPTQPVQAQLPQLQLQQQLPAQMPSSQQQLPQYQSTQLQTPQQVTAMPAQVVQGQTVTSPNFSQPHVATGAIGSVPIAAAVSAVTSVPTVTSMPTVTSIPVVTPMPVSEPIPALPTTALPIAASAALSAELPATAKFSHGYCRVNISWGGGTPLVWQGGITLSDGEMRHLTLLGSEPDVPGSIWLEGNSLGICSLAAKSYSGVHVTLDCGVNAQLQINLTDRDKKINVTTSVPVAQLLKGPVQQSLDESGNRIRIERVPGDELSIHMGSSPSVFAPGERLAFEVLPRYLSHAKEKKHFLNVSLFRCRTNDRVSETEWPVIDETIPQASPLVPVSFALPQEEGVFDVVLTLYQKNDRIALLGGKDKILVQRTFQCLVMSPVPPAASSIDSQAIQQGNFRGMLVENIDPANPGWWRRFAKSSILPRISLLGTASPAPAVAAQYEPFPEPDGERSTLDSVRDRFSQLAPGQLLPRNQEPTLWHENFGSGHVVPYQSTKYSTLGFVEMIPSGDEKQPAWEAYAIPINEPGKPHYLEVDYLSGIPQTLGISIVEPTISGGLFPATIDSGIYVARELVTDNLDGQTMQHRILFWPKTKTPIILMTNQNVEQSAVYGGMRIYRAPDVFPQSQRSAGAETAIGHKQSRLFAAYLHRPNFCDNFSATRMSGHIPNVGVTDWETFYQGISRTVQYMRMTGCGGLMVSVASDGSCLYPSELLSPTPRYDSGAFLANGEDPVRKDVLYALATAFDRENLTLIPAIDFCMPLPALEAQVRRNDNTALTVTPAESGIAVIGPYGNPLADHYAGQNQTGRAPYYNLLNPKVQNAMLDVVRELVAKSAKHPSFGGVAVQLSPEGYAMLPEEYWGLDDDTIRRFSRDTHIEVPGEGPSRFAMRAEFLRSQRLEQWLRWRAAQVSDFYRRMAEIVTEARPDAKLYLAGAKMFDSPLCQRLFAPSLTQPGSVYQAMAYHGFDISAYQTNSDIVFMRPEKVVAESQLAKIAANLELTHADMGAVFQQMTSQRSDFACLFYHQPIERTLPGFDAKSPFQPANSWFSIEAVPAAEQNRMRFVRHLARHDVTDFFDGGVMLPLGEEDAIRDFITQYQMLPRARFQTCDSGENDSTQPVTVRYINTERGTYCYVVNDAAFSVPVKITFEARQGTKLTPLSSQREIGQLRVISNGFEWSQTLQPYDFVAFVISDVKGKPSEVNVSCPANIAGTNGRLNKQLKQLYDRIWYARNWLEWEKLPNPGFEMTLEQWAAYMADQHWVQQQNPAITTPNGDALPGEHDNAQSKPRSFAALPRPQFGNFFAGRDANINAGELAAQSQGQQQGQGQAVGVAADVLRGGHNAIIPGWQVEGDATFQAVVDAQKYHEGTNSLRLTAQQAGGRLVSIPFEAPQTGRLFVSFWVGISENAEQLPLKLVVQGQYNDHPLVRSATIGPAIWHTISQVPPVDGLRWHPVVIQFKDLPLTGIDSLTVQFEMYGAGTVWVDDLRLYHLAFTDAEHTLLQRMAKVAGYRLSIGRISDAVSIFDGYWSQLLAENLPNIDEIVAQQAAAAAVATAQPQPEAPPPVAEEPKKKTLSDRIKDFKWW